LEYFTKEEKIDDKIIRVKIWDTAGQEKFKSLTRNFYKNSQGVLICYDVTNRLSFQNIETWVNSVKDNSSSNIKMVLVGNKIDLNREVSTEEGKNLADLNHIPFFETSAKTNIGINECFIKLITDIVIDFNNFEEGVNLDNKNKNENNNNKYNRCNC
jgi:Ras-related protein Rab-1A